MKRIIVLIAMSLILIYGIITMVNNIFCFDDTHRGIYPVNPYCTKCHGRDGFTQHECTNPNGEDKYCRLCGKKVVNK